MAIELADKLYTSTQVADILGVSLRTLYRYMEDNKIKSMRTASGRHRFTKDHIIEFLNAGRVGGMDDGSSQGSYNNQRNSGYSNMPQNQGPAQNAQRGNYSDNMQAAPNNMPNPYAPPSNFSNPNQPAQTRSSMYGQGGNTDMQNDRPMQSTGQFNQPVVDQEDDFQFDVREYDYDSPKQDDLKTDEKINNDIQPDTNKFDDEMDDADFTAPRQNYDQDRTPTENRFDRNVVTPPAPVQQPEQSQPVQQAQSRQEYSQSTFAPPANSSSAREEAKPESLDLGTNLNVRYYRSDYTDLIELAKKIKDTSNAKDLEYAFTLYAGLSLHFLIRPFTVLNFYANPEDMQLWKDELRLVPSPKKEDANVGIIINTDIVFVPTKEIGGFKVVEDKVLMKDLSAVREEELVKQFRQYLTSI